MTIDELRTLRGLSMTKLCDAAGLSMGAIFRLTRPGADITGARLETLMKLAAGLDAVITIDPEGVTIRPKEETDENYFYDLAEGLHCVPGCGNVPGPRFRWYV